MPITPDKVEKARGLLQKSEAYLATLKPGDPEYDRTSGIVNSARSQINALQGNARSPDGKIKENLPDPTGGTYEVKGGDSLSYEQFYEPSLESVRSRVANDRNLRERLGLPEFSGPRGSQTVAQDAVNQALLQQGGLQQYPSVDTIDENSSVYKAVAEDDWNQRATKAKTEGKNLRRYSKIALKDEPIEKAAGFIGKHAPGIAATVVDTAFPLARFAREQGRDFQRQQNETNNANLDITEESEIQEMKDRTPASFPAALAASAVPMAIGNKAVGAVMKAGNYAARSPIGKALIGGVGGALGSVAEGELQAAGEEYSAPDASVDNYLKGASERVTQNALFGGTMGAAGDLISQGAKGIQKGMRESERFQDVNKLEAAGGGTHPIKGITVPENVQRNISEASKVGAIGRPEDLAAARVAPKISEHVERQAQETYNAIDENLKKYHNSKEGLTPKRITEPVRVAIDFIKSKLNRGDLGTISETDPVVVRNLREKLGRFVERKEVSQAQFEAMKAQYGDDIIEMDPTEADELFGVKTTQNEKPTTFPNNDEEVLRDMHGKRIYVDPEEAARYASGQNPFKNPYRATDGKPVQSPDGLTPPQDNLLSEGQSLLGEGAVGTDAQGLSVAGESNPFELPAMQTAIPSVYPVRDPEHVVNQKAYLKNILGPGRQARAVENQKLLGMGKEFADVNPGGEPSFPSNSGPNTKTVLIPRQYPSKQMEDHIQTIADEIKNSKDHKGWLKTLDQSFRKVRDKFGSNDHTPIGEKLDDGTELSGLSALQRAHSRAQEKLTQVKTDTSAEYGSAIHNKVRSFDTGGNFAADKELLQQAKELGIEKDLRAVTGAAVGPSLKSRAFFNSPHGLLQGGIDAAAFRADPILRAIGNVEPNPFTADPNSPAGRIQKYLFEDSAKNLLNLQGGRLGRFGNEINDERNSQ
jgi:hypothetical protein